MYKKDLKKHDKDLDLDVLENLILQDLSLIKQRLQEGGTKLENSEGQYGRYFIHLACIHKRLDVVRLIKDLDKKSPKGKNALHYAFEYEAIDIIVYLLDIRPQLLYEVENGGLSPIQLANVKGGADRILVFLIRQYIKNENKAVRLAINSIHPSMRSWTRENFFNYLGNDSEDEYSDDSDNETYKELHLRDESLYNKEELKKSAEILKKHGNFSRDNLSSRLKILMKKIGHDVSVVQESIKGFTEAKDRIAYFPTVSVLKKVKIQFLGNQFDNEVELLNFAIRSGTCKIKCTKECLPYQITIFSQYEGKSVEYTLKAKYYLVGFRGISYLVDRWQSKSRRAHRRQPVGMDFVNFAEANVMQDPDFYKRTNYEDIDFQVLKKNAKALKTKLIELKRSQPVIFSKKEGILLGLAAKSTKLLEFENYLDLLQYMFSNGIVNFLNHIEKFNQRFPGIFPNNRNPLLPFGHLPFHASKYAFGDKDPYSDFALPPLWDNLGRPRKPHIGKLTLSIYELADFLGFDQPNVVPYLSQVAGISVGFDIGPEYELSFLSYIPQSRIFKQKIIRYPSFHHVKCPEKYLAKYGLDESLYQGFRNCILNPGTRENATLVLRGWLCLYHTIKAMDEVAQEILTRNAIMLFYHPDGTFHPEYPSEAYKTNSGLNKHKQELAEAHISSASPVLNDDDSWGTPKSKDRRGVYETNDVPHTPRRSPSGNTPKGKRLNLASPTTYSPISPSGDSLDVELDRIFALLDMNGHNVVIVNNQEISTLYWYEDMEMRMILQHLIDQYGQKTNDGRPIYLLGPLDNLSPIGFLEVLQQHQRRQGVVLIPYNLSQLHWVGIILEYDANGRLIRAEYYDSNGGPVPEYLNVILRRLGGSDDQVSGFKGMTTEEGLILQDNGSDCGPCTIENLWCGAMSIKPTSSFNSGNTRALHREYIKQRNDVFSHTIYERQRFNQSSFSILREKNSIHLDAGSENIGLTEYTNLLFVAHKIMNLPTNIQIDLKEAITQSGEDGIEHAIVLTKIRSVLENNIEHVLIEELARQFFSILEIQELSSASLKLDYNKIDLLGIVLGLPPDELEQDLKLLTEQMKVENGVSVSDMVTEETSPVFSQARKIDFKY